MYNAHYFKLLGLRLRARRLRERAAVTPTTKESAMWTEMIAHAETLPDAELARHASVSTQNRHRCTECFTCACEHVRRARMDPLVRVLATATPEQARLLWTLLAGHVEDQTIEEQDVQSAARLLAQLDAAMASFAR